MTKSAQKTLDYLYSKDKYTQVFEEYNGFVVIRNLNYVYSMGTKGGLILHTMIFSDKFHPNGSWANK